MSIKKKVRKKLEAERIINDDSYSASGLKIPQYDASGRVLNPEKKKLKPLNIIGTSLLCGIAVLVCAIYVPQFSMRPDISGSLIAATDKDQYSIMQAYVYRNAAEDFDGDGLENRDELDAGSNPYIADTDLDGVADGRDSQPLKQSTDVYRAILDAGQSIKTPYSVNGVILWPDNEDAWVKGSVIQTMTGYQFSNFKGLAKFPFGKFAYKYEDGRHTMLKYHEETGAWVIKEDCLVTLTEKEMKTTNLISVFGLKTYLQGGFGNFLSAVLPERGWLTGVNMWVDDTYVSTEANTYADFGTYNPMTVPEARLSSYSNSLEDLAEVYSLLDQGYYVMASLISPSQGESIVEIIGYTYDGDLIAANPQDETRQAVITMKPMGIRCIGSDAMLAQYSYFDFAGCGYDSLDGAMISFFAAGKGGVGNEAMNEGQQEPTISPEETISETVSETQTVETEPEVVEETTEATEETIHETEAPPETTKPAATKPPANTSNSGGTASSDGNSSSNEVPAQTTPGGDYIEADGEGVTIYTGLN